jgi:hypothetical protein
MSTLDCNTPAAHEFETLTITPLLDALCSAYDAARSLAAGDKRWASALDTAWNYLLESETVEYSIEGWAIRVESASEQGKTYIANGSCGCKAFEKGQACWHRASARLLRRAIEPRLMVYAQEWDQAAAEARGQIVAVMVQRRRELAQIEVDELFPTAKAA